MKHRILKVIQSKGDWYSIPVSSKSLQRFIGGSLYSIRKVLKDLHQNGYIKYSSVAVDKNSFDSSVMEYRIPVNGYFVTEEGRSYMEMH